MLPKHVADIRIPDSAIAKQAYELARETSPEFLLNHVLRTYAFGALFAEKRGWTIDEELFFLSAVLHDLGLTEQGQGPLRFEVEGADWAERFLREKNYPQERTAVVWDAIALHTTVGVAERKQPEIALVQFGAWLDVIGMRHEELDPDRVAAVIAAFPRLDFKREIVQAFVAAIEANPSSAMHAFTMDLARASVPSFHCPSYPELIQRAPFAE